MSVFFVAAHALIVNNEHKFLIGRRPQNDDYMPLHWDIPGGTVEEGERVEDSLLREVREETNLTVIPVKPIFVYSNLSQLPKRQTIQIVYSCTYLGGNIVLEPREHDEYRWVDAASLAGLNCIAFLKSMYEQNILEYLNS